MRKYEQALTDYITVLETSAKKTHRAEDRSMYRDHLAVAALMFAAIAKDRSNAKLRELVASERHTYGWGYLDGTPGEEAESAFHKFASMVEDGQNQT